MRIARGFAGHACEAPVIQGAPTMRTRLRQWMRDETGQDLIEYALLAGFLALAGIVGFNAVATAFSSTYMDGNTAVQDLWEVPAP